uniref:Uncharacterized protein n=1 Tax=Oryza sativa subsp. japonica TaxID=39947 RepID=Q651N4_ORYSJ|nr:hypothetical protein [Oryza sativa Japonica Group]
MRAGRVRAVRLLHRTNDGCKGGYRRLYVRECMCAGRPLPSANLPARAMQASSSADHSVGLSRHRASARARYCAPVHVRMLSGLRARGADAEWPSRRTVRVQQVHVNKTIDPDRPAACMNMRIDRAFSASVRCTPYGSTFNAQITFKSRNFRSLMR